MIKSTIYLTHNEIKKLINSEEGLELEVFQEVDGKINKEAEKIVINLSQIPIEEVL